MPLDYDPVFIVVKLSCLRKALVQFHANFVQVGFTRDLWQLKIILNHNFVKT